jgi:hypothetical protein
MVPPTHKPGIQMGDIDRMSRLAAYEHATDLAVQSRCPTLKTDTMLALPHDKLNALFLLLDPHHTGASNADHHDAFVKVHSALNDLTNSLT